MTAGIFGIRLDDVMPVAEAAARPLHGLKIKAIRSDVWDEMALTFRDVQQEQLQCFNEQRWAPDQLERLAFLDGETPVGAVMVRLVAMPVIGATLAVVRYGPLWRRVGQADDPGVLRRIHLALAERYASRKNSALVVYPPSEPAGGESELFALANAGFQALPGGSAPERYFVDVSGSAEDVRKSFSQKWRYNLKKAEKAGLTAELMDAEAGLPVFRVLYEAMLSRKGFNDSAPVDTLDALVNARQDALRPMFCVVSKDGEPVAAAVIDCSGERAVYLYGATSDRALPLRAGYLMQSRVVEHLTQMSDIIWYDLGGGSGPECSLHQFKRGMAGKDGAITNVAPPHMVASSRIATIVGRGLLLAKTLRDDLPKMMGRPAKAA